MSKWSRFYLASGILVVIGVGGAHFGGAPSRGAFARQKDAARGTEAAAVTGRADAAITAGDWTGAVIALRQVLQARPRDVSANRDLAWALERDGREEEAAAFLAARPWLYRDTAATAGADSGSERRSPEVAAARDRVRRQPHDAAAHAALAEARVTQARAQTAALAARCEICHQREPPLSGSAVTRILFPDRDTLLQAVAERQTAARLRSSPADAFRIGEIYFYLATLYPPRHPEAREYMVRARRSLERAVQQAPREGAVWSSLALARLKLDDFAGAEAAWRQALALDGTQEEARINLAALLPSRGRLGEAVSLYAEGMRLMPGSAALRTNYGVLLWQQGLVREAVAAQREALRMKPGDAVALLNLGLALKAAGDPAGAEAALRESLRRRPAGAVAHNALGSLLAQRGDWEAAARAFTEAARCNPALAAARANLGRACEQLGRWPEAADAYQRAILWEPARSRLWARVAEARARSGDHRRAGEAAGHFLAAHPRDPAAEALRRQLGIWNRAQS